MHVSTTYITYHESIIRDTNGNPSRGPSGYTECHIVSLHTVTGLVVSSLSREISKALGWKEEPRVEEEEWSVSGKKGEEEKGKERVTRGGGGRCKGGRKTWKELSKGEAVRAAMYKNEEHYKVSL